MERDEKQQKGRCAMADINQLVPLIKRWEGGYADDPADLGAPPTKASR